MPVDSYPESGKGMGRERHKKKPAWPWQIYSLSDPRTGQVRYVGITHWPISHRYGGHLSKVRRGGKTRRDNWIRSLLALGLNPVCTVIERGTGKSWGGAEQQWIALYRGTCDLTNLTDGGEGTPGRILSFEHREKIAESFRELWKSPQYRSRLSAAHVGKKHSPERKASIALAMTGKVLSAATRAKIKASWDLRKRKDGLI